MAQSSPPVALTTLATYDRHDQSQGFVLPTPHTPFAMPWVKFCETKEIITLGIIMVSSFGWDLHLAVCNKVLHLIDSSQRLPHVVSHWSQPHSIYCRHKEVLFMPGARGFSTLFINIQAKILSSLYHSFKSHCKVFYADENNYQSILFL